MTIFDFISLFGGLALFIYGMHMMSDALERGSSGTLKKAMEKVTNNPFVGFLLGLLITAIIQSSTATIVLTSGLVAAGIISLHQSLGIIIGANVGTTVTGQIIRLLDLNSEASSWLNIFKPSTLAPFAAIVGIVLIMAFSFKSAKNIGAICMGFGVLFTGLLNMTSAVEPLSTSDTFANLFITFSDKPFIGFLIGLAAAFTTQSSSATVGILQTLSTTGQLTFSSIYSVILGIYLGDCVTTAIVCAIGAKADAKRTGVIHILFNLAQIALILGVIAVLRHFGFLGGIWNKAVNSGDIANANTVFKLVGAIVLLPVCVLFEKLSRVIVRDDVTKSVADDEIKALDDALFDSPMLALASAHKVISAMGRAAFDNVRAGMRVVTAFDQSAIDGIREAEERIDLMTDRASNYLVSLSPSTTAEFGNDQLNYYLRCVTEFERIGDHAVNLTESAAEMRDRDLVFTPTAAKELELLGDAIDEIMTYTARAFFDADKSAALKIEPIEEVIDDLVDTMRASHLRRLREGNCNVYTGSVFLDVLVNIERVSDQCSNIGVHTCFILDPDIAPSAHDYIQRLHSGEDSFFNTLYSEAREKYFSRLEEIAAEEMAAATAAVAANA